MIKQFFSRKRQSFDDDDRIEAEEYVELDTSSSRGDGDQKVIVRPFVITDFADVKPILDSLRESYTIALINIKPLKDKDLLELKRCINKLKKTCEAIEGDIAGFGDDYIVVTPNFAEIYRGSSGMDAGFE
ncbi:MAG: cell division protein SepF [Nanoarchaeota archaeon]|nr:cell division protein SepF [Nanoarchaeota archaeon]